MLGLSRWKLTARAALLALVAITIVLALAVPVRVFVSQRAQVAALTAADRAAAARIAALSKQARDWQDPGYVETQARDQLHFVLPGEAEYLVFGGSTMGPRSRPGGAVTTRRSGLTWYSALWKSVVLAGRRQPIRSGG